jgi:hypothetical protein
MAEGVDSEFPKLAANKAITRNMDISVFMTVSY